MNNTVNQSIMPTTAKINDNGHIEIAGCDVVELAEKYGTPLYVYDEETIRKCCRQYKEAFYSYSNVSILFASKAFMTQAICAILEDEGFGLDVVSGGEIYTASSTNFPMERCYFNGNNKSSEELEFAIETGIGRITIDNFLEMELLDSIAQSKNIQVDVILRITPGIECHTHEYIQTGHLDSKFGFDLTQIDEAVELIKERYSHLNLKGLHGHIGSQIFETHVYSDLVEIIVSEFARIRDKFDITLEEMNLGGGLGVQYVSEDDPPSIYGIAEAILASLTENLVKYDLPNPKIIIEPGRSIVSSAGVTLYTVGSSKQVPEGKKYVAVDGGMSDNPRPAMYQAKYYGIVANKANEKASETVTIAGRYCESGDILINNAELPEVEPGDIICIFCTGAYNYSMSSNYNRVPKPAGIIVHEGYSDVIIKRETYQDLIARDVIPQRLKKNNCNLV
jgi:diaminopimelate decarboxylase